MKGSLHLPDCSFCHRAVEKDYDGARWIHDAPGIMNFEPLNPVTPGHRLFVPMVHVEHGQLLARIVASTFQAAYEYATMGRLVGQQPGTDFNLIISSGAAATQTMAHIHVHYVPRRPNDKLHLPWTGQKK